MDTTGQGQHGVVLYRRVTTQSIAVERDTLLCNLLRLSRYNKTQPCVNGARRNHRADSAEFFVMYARANATPYKLLLYLAGRDNFYTVSHKNVVPPYFEQCCIKYFFKSISITNYKLHFHIVFEKNTFLNYFGKVVQNTKYKIVHLAKVIKIQNTFDCA